MKRLTVLAAVAALAVSGCASTSSSPGYFNMSNLQSAIQSQMNSRLSSGDYNVTVTSVSCFLSGSGTASCSALGSDGTTWNVTATISSDGSSFTTPGTYTPSGNSGNSGA